MARPALIEKLMQPAKWLFRKELIPLDDIAGSGLKKISDKLNVDFSEMPAAQLRQMVLAMILANGGLAVDNNGKLYVDFSQMGTDRFDAMIEEFRKSLRLPKWLTGNLIVYVNANHAAAADTLGEGRGLSADMPFKTIQAAVNYLCENFNIGAYTATINVAAGEYAPVTLGDFSRTTGKIVLKGASGAIISRNTVGFVVNVAAGYWQIENFKVIFDVEFGASTPAAVFMGAFNVADGSTLISKGIDLNVKASGTNSVSRILYGYSVNGSLSIEPSEAQTKIVFDTDSVAYLTKYGMNSGGSILLNSVADSSLNGNIVCSGDYTVFAVANSKGGITRSAVYATKITFSGNCTGKRYDCNRGGTMSMVGAGAEYFPGNAAGTVDDSTYSWYK